MEGAGPAPLGLADELDDADGGPDAKVAKWQNMIDSFLWIAPGWRAQGDRGGRNPEERKGSNFAA